MTIQLTKHADGTFDVKIKEKTNEEINHDYDMMEMQLDHDNWVQRVYSHLICSDEFFHIEYPSFQHP